VYIRTGAFYVHGIFIEEQFFLRLSLVRSTRLPYIKFHYEQKARINSSPTLGRENKRGVRFSSQASMNNIPYIVEVITEYKVSTPDGKYSVRMATEDEAIESLRKLLESLSN
jgi:hypothetical protein